ncbi:MAG: disulfide reductase [Clostridiales bacterium]|nr:disulfide reductase [Clostridiales bacterium]
MRYSYYPGCTLKTKAKELDRYARLSAVALGVELEELPAWQCCGAVYPMARDEIATRLSAVRALMSARDAGQTLVTVCSACHNVLKQTNEALKTDANFRMKVDNYLDPAVPYAGEARVIHYLELLRDEIGFDEVKKRIANPLKGRKIAGYYGCLLLRPSPVMAFDDPENPRVLEDFILTLGAEPVFYGQRNECCGAYVALEDRAQAEKSARKIVRSAVDGGAETIVTACPLCLFNLKNSAGGIPVRYITELLAEALGLGEGA